jgi:uncharacterized protein (DUF1330 family)
MPAYIIVDVNIHDTKRYEDYKKLTPSSLAVYDGEFVARGGRTETLEGGWEPGRIAILKFPNADKARAWWSSSEYHDAKLLRQSIATTRMILVDGV